jgi:uncharacterized protein (TIGR02271 family)
MNSAERVEFRGENGERGWIDPRLPLVPNSPDPYTFAHLDTGEDVPVALSRLVRERDGTYTVLSSQAVDGRPVRNPLENMPQVPPDEVLHQERPEPAHPAHIAHVANETVVPVIEERAHVGKRQVEKGRVAVTKVVDEKHQVVDMPLMHEEAHVERVPVGQFVETAPAPREENGVLIVPLVEEVIVMEKRLYVKEELRISKTQGVYRNPTTVTLRSERAVVTREQPQEPGAMDQASNTRPTG